MQMLIIRADAAMLDPSEATLVQTESITFFSIAMKLGILWMFVDHHNHIARGEVRECNSA